MVAYFAIMPQQRHAADIVIECIVPRAEGFDPVNVFRIGLHCKHIKLTRPISKAEILFGKGELFPEGAAGIGGAFTKNPVG